MPAYAPDGAVHDRVKNLINQLIHKFKNSLIIITIFCIPPLRFLLISAMVIASGVMPAAQLAQIAIVA